MYSIYPRNGGNVVYSCSDNFYNLNTPIKLKAGLTSSEHQQFFEHSLTHHIKVATRSTWTLTELLSGTPFTFFCELTLLIMMFTSYSGCHNLPLVHLLCSWGWILLFPNTCLVQRPSLICKITYLLYTTTVYFGAIHCKKLPIFSSPAGMSLTKPRLGIIQFFPDRESLLIVTSWPRTGEIANLFFFNVPLSPSSSTYYLHTYRPQGYSTSLAYLLLRSLLLLFALKRLIAWRLT